MYESEPTKMMDNAVATKYKLLLRTSDEGYIYLGNNFKLYFCDHSGDDRCGSPRGPEACHDPVSPIDIKSVANAPCNSNGAYHIKRQDGFTVLLSKRVHAKLLELIKVLNILN